MTPAGREIRLLPLDLGEQEVAEGVRAKCAVYRARGRGGELEGILQLHRDRNWRLFTGPFGARFEQVLGETLGQSRLRRALEPNPDGMRLGFIRTGPGRKKRLAWAPAKSDGGEVA